MLPSWSGRNFDVVMVARISMSVGRALAGVVTPIYLALRGFSAFELSEYVLVVALCAAGLSASVGLWSDQVGRRPFLVGMPMLTALAGVIFAFTGSVPLLFVFGALGSFGRGAGAGAGAVGPYQPAESAFVTDQVDPRFRNAAFGRLASASAAGSVVGGLLALLVSSAHLHGAAATAAFRPAFIAVAVVSAIAGLCALWLVEPSRSGSPGPRSGQAGSRRASGERRWRLPQKSRWLLYRLWATNTVNGMAVGMFGPFVTYWFYRRYGASAAEVGVLFAVINVVSMFSTLSAAGLARRWGLVRTTSVIRSAQALLLVPMVLSPSFAIAGAVYLVRMVVQRIGMPLRQSYAIGLADPAERASVAALSNLPSQLAMAGSPLLTGYLFEEVSLSLPFVIAAGLQFLNAASFWLLFRRHPPEEERSADGPGARSRSGAPPPGSGAPGA
ncbi:MAG: MFS transporter [Actinomycetota bacterium]|nr:MFS transporter [Actinomycetota bacterium]